MNQQKIDASRLYADIRLENEEPTSLVFYEKNKKDDIIYSWETDLTLDYEVVDGVVTYPRKKLHEATIDESQMKNLQIPLYNIALYFFNHKMLNQNEIIELEEKLLSLYDTHHENFEEYIEETFAHTNFKHMKYFYSAYLIQELMNTFQMLDCLNKKEEINNKKLILKMR